MMPLRWTMLALCLAATLLVAWRAQWATNLDTPDGRHGIVHADRAPLWAPPDPQPPDMREHANARVRPASASAQVEPRWQFMLLELLVLLAPVTLFCGWLYTRVRRRRRDRVLHLALHVGCGLTLGMLASILLWFVVGGWGPALLPFACGGGAAGLATGSFPYARRAARPLHANG